MSLTPPFKRNTIVLKGRGYHEDAFSTDSTPISPGMLVARQTDGTLKHHAVSGGVGELLFAKEDALQGKWLNDTYANGDLVSYYQGLEGDHVLVLIPAGATAINDGAPMMSNGDGTMVLRTSTNFIFGYLDNGGVALDNSLGSSPVYACMRLAG